MNKSTQNGYYKLKIYQPSEDNKLTRTGSRWLCFNRLFGTKIKEVTGKDIFEFGEYLKQLDESIDLAEKFDAFTDLAHAAMLAYSEKEGEDIDYTGYNVGEWLYYAMENDDTVLLGITSALQNSLPKPGKKRAGRFTPPQK